MTIENDVWYRDGLRFECTRCGNCCTGEPGYVWLNGDEITAIAGFVEMPDSEFLAAYTKRAPRGVTLREKPNGDCVFYDGTRGCTIYELRPRQCRTWPFWESNVESPRAWERMRRGCPGAGQGDLIPVEEITRRLKVIPL
jgi:Fe-S-cluster containining protein